MLSKTLDVIFKFRNRTGVLELFLSTGLDRLHMVSRLILIIIPPTIVILFVTWSFFHDAVISFAGCADYCFSCEIVGDRYCADVEINFNFGWLLLILGLSVAEIILVIGKIWNRKNKSVKP